MELHVLFSGENYINFCLQNFSSLRFTILTFEIGRTRNAPPPAASVIIATYFGLTEQNVESSELFVIRILS